MTRTRSSMLSTLALLLTAGAAGAQIAANGITILVDDPVLEPGQSTTVRMEAYFDARDFCMSWVATSLLSSAGAQGLEGPSLIQPMDGPGATAGVIDGAGVGGIIAGQLHGFIGAGIFGDPTNPMAFWEVTYTAPTDVAAPLSVELETLTTRFDVHTDPWEFSEESRLDDFAEGEATIRVVPAPAGVAVLGGLLLAARREPRRIVRPPVA
ncbi:MAG: hypothetical protein RIE32_02940 [Phycisphaerales bacterium]